MIRIFFVLLFFITSAASAQQMVVTKKGRILTRYNLGVDIYFTMKGDEKQVRHSAILSIREFEFITLQKDTIPFNQVARLKFRSKGMGTYIKSTLIASAGLLALHFALKPAFGDSNPQAVNGLAYVAGSGVVSIVFALATSRRQMKIQGFKRLKFINYDSPAYK
jgi:hypothetical protein